MVYGRDSGFILLSIPNVQIHSRQSLYSQNGTLTVECIYVTPAGQAAIDRDVFLILQINSNEIPLDPRRIITLGVPIEGAPERIYVLHRTDLESEELELHIPVFDSEDPQELQRLEDVDTLEGIFTEYANFRESQATSVFASQNIPLKDVSQAPRGHLVLVNEDSGEIIGEVDKKISVHEEPALSHSETGHEHDPVVIEIGQDEEGQTVEVFARTIPADQQDWITNSAKLVSQGISQSTNLLMNIVSSASNYYINHSSPSISRPASSIASNIPGSGASSKSSSSSSKAIAFISSSRTQTGLTHAHALTAQAVKVSGKTLSLIDDMISKIIGNKSKPSTAVPSSSSIHTGMPPPPPYSKPLLPPRNTSEHLKLPGPEKPPLPPRHAVTAPPLPPRTLTKKVKLVLSADLILSTIDESLKQLIDVGGRSATRVVQHRYGSEAAQSTALMAGTARNVALVYIDMQGVGRKALIKRVSKQYVKSKLANSKRKVD
ncbi:senescence-associated protein-domain-containing protein [Lentinula guzmanii]|uniref:Senescence-associated protein-domain-containing protein n=1 Tax=Lentinula guzmanii TaxID=2804957 RepID=A0AA38JGE8_9AGAR|nr:senescence-associated protein-domain-containing protein [Lentinula guzmanii]